MRLFLATTFPGEVLSELNGRSAGLKPRLPAASWVRPESQHLTFAFLGEQPESLLAKIEPELQSSIARVSAFPASLRGSGFFPNARHARVGWIGLDPEAPFVHLAGVVREAVTRSGGSFDGSDFKPHLTLMRIRDPWPPASIDLFQRSLRDYRSAEFNVDRVTLYSSQLDPKGAVHTPLMKFDLGT